MANDNDAAERMLKATGGNVPLALFILFVVLIVVCTIWVLGIVGIWNFVIVPAFGVGPINLIQGVLIFFGLMALRSFLSDD